MNPLTKLGIAALLSIAALKAPGAIADTTRVNQVLEQRLTNSNTPKQGGAASNIPALEQKLNVFKDYEDPVFQMYDSKIIENTKFWNDYFTNTLPFKFTPLDPNDVKRQMLIESAGHPKTAWLYDPMQLANKGDTGLSDLQSMDMEHLIQAYSELKSIKPTPWKKEEYTKIVKGKKVKKSRQVLDYSNNGYFGNDFGSRITPDLSIKYGIRYLFQKALVFGYQGTGENRRLNPVGMRQWADARARYGPGKDYYEKRIQDLKPVGQD